jgi:hypothetical protein
MLWKKEMCQMKMWHLSIPCQGEWTGKWGTSFEGGPEKVASSQN